MTDYAELRRLAEAAGGAWSGVRLRPAGNHPDEQVVHEYANAAAPDVTLALLDKAERLDQLALDLAAIVWRHRHDSATDTIERLRAVLEDIARAAREGEPDGG